MREIKFRGINMEGQWVYGYLGKDWDNDVSITTIFNSDVLCSCEYKVLPESVGQYTGLKDENGREIYEGDIVRHATWGDVYEVIFEDGGFHVLSSYDFQTINEYPLEVIGNIYENPELLEVERNE